MGFPVMLSSVTPGGIVTRNTYEILVGKTLDSDMSDPELNVIFVPSAKYKYGRFFLFILSYFYEFPHTPRATSRNAF